MQERVNKIIDFLLQEISQSSESVQFDLEKISQRLLAEGYTEREIDKAVQWVIMNLGNRQVPPHLHKTGKKTPSIRVLMPEEIRFFTKEAYGYLIQLQSLGILSALQIEPVIERCFLMGLHEVDVEELRAIISQVLMEDRKDPSATNSVFSPGNDKIN